MFADEVQLVLNLFLFTHFFSMISCISFELIKEPSGLVMLLIRGGEMISTLAYMLLNLQGMTLLFQFFDYQNTSELDCYRVENHEKFLGMSIAWLLIEFLVYCTFLLTMLICLIKSFFNHAITADNSKMFQPKMLVLMANKLCQTLIIQCEKDRDEFPQGFFSE